VSSPAWPPPLLTAKDAALHLRLARDRRAMLAAQLADADEAVQCLELLLDEALERIAAELEPH